MRADRLAGLAPRVRDRIVGNRTQLICQMRAFGLGYGIAIPGRGAFKLDIARIIRDETNDLTPRYVLFSKRQITPAGC
jgi:hypothetical protein